MESPGPVPLTVVSGALGVGKTSAVLSLLDQRPPGARWVVLVNEHGEVGIDGALLEGGTPPTADLAVRELAGGCLCCQSALPVQQSVRRVLDELAPERLILECSGVADPGRVCDQLLASPALSERIDLRATLTLVDPRAVAEPRRRTRSWQAQVDAAAVLVLNRLDLCDGPTLRSALAWADALFPEKDVVATTVGGELDASWLELPGRRTEPSAALPLAADWVDQTGMLPDSLGQRLFQRHDHSADHTTVGWSWPPDAAFEHDVLINVLNEFQDGSGALPQGTMRLKAVVHTTAGWRAVHVDEDGVHEAPTAWRRDSRLVIICGPRPAVERPALDAALESALVAEE